MKKLVILCHAPNGRRRRGRFPTRWVDAAKLLLDIRVTRATELTKNREGWKNTIFKVFNNLRAYYPRVDT